MNISIIGTGYVGLVTGVCLASLGMNVLCCDIDAGKIAQLQKGLLPIYEPGLGSLLSKCIKRKNRLVFTTQLKSAVEHSDVIFITVNTPTNEDNTCDLKHVFEVARGIANYMTCYKVIINKSTVPVGTGQKVKEEIRKVLAELNRPLDFDVVSNPEFLKEGSAVYDFINAERIVIGAESERAISLMKEAYYDQILCNIPLLVTSIETAEMIKYASNAFLAAKISFINEIAAICELYNADVTEVARGMGLDSRIGPQFLRPGPGFGGSCFPKDVRALTGMALKEGYTPYILKSILEMNNRQSDRMVEKISTAMGGLENRNVAMLGVAFKAETDDIRESPALSIIHSLLSKKAAVRVYDPKATKNLKKEQLGLPLKYCRTAYSACSHCDCIVLATDWKEFLELDFEKLRRIVRKAIFVDLRNMFDPSYIKSFGFYYEGVGRK